MRGDEPGTPLVPALWPDPDSGPWRIKTYWQMFEGRLECVGVEITSVPLRDDSNREIPSDWKRQPIGLTSTVLRRLNLGSKIEDWRREIAWFDVFRARMFQPERFVELATRATAVLGDRRSTRGRRRLTDDQLKEVASIYLEALAEGRWPRLAVAEQLSLSPPAAGKRIYLARQAGYLGPTKPGIAGGLPTQTPEEHDDES